MHNSRDKLYESSFVCAVNNRPLGSNSSESCHLKISPIVLGCRLGLVLRSSDYLREISTITSSGID